MFAVLESIWNVLQNPYCITDLTLGMLLHYFGKLKMQIFCRYSAYMEEKIENANKLHFCRLYLCYSNKFRYSIFSMFEIVSFLRTDCK